MKREAYQKTYEFEREHWWFVGRRKILRDMLGRFVKDPRGKVIVDVGCGTGLLLAEMQHYTRRIGIDTSEEILKLSPYGDEVELIHADATALPLERGSVDTVLLLDVLEHLDREAEVLGEVRAVLKEGGRVVATVPAFRFLWSGEDEVSLHKRRYVKRELRNVLETHGFEVESISYFNMFLMPLMWGFILFSRLFNPQQLHRSNLFSLPRPLNAAFESLLFFESWILGKTALPFGSSLISVAKKSGSPGHP